MKKNLIKKGLLKKFWTIFDYKFNNLVLQIKKY